MWPWRRRRPEVQRSAPPPDPAPRHPAPPAPAGSTPSPAGSTPSPAGSTPSPAGRTPPPAWRTLPAIQRTVTGDPLLNRTDRFTGTLAAWRDPSYLGPLGHAIGPGEPAGLLHGVAVPAGPAQAEPAAPASAPAAEPATPAPSMPLAVPARPPTVSRLVTAPALPMSVTLPVTPLPVTPLPVTPPVAPPSALSQPMATAGSTRPALPESTISAPVGEFDDVTAQRSTDAPDPLGAQDLAGETDPAAQPDLVAETTPDRDLTAAPDREPTSVPTLGEDWAGPADLPLPGPPTGSAAEPTMPFASTPAIRNPDPGTPVQRAADDGPAESGPSTRLIGGAPVVPRRLGLGEPIVPPLAPASASGPAGPGDAAGLLGGAGPLRVSRLATSTAAGPVAAGPVATTPAAGPADTGSGAVGSGATGSGVGGGDGPGQVGHLVPVHRSTTIDDAGPLHHSAAVDHTPVDHEPPVGPASAGRPIYEQPPGPPQQELTVARLAAFDARYPPESTPTDPQHGSATDPQHGSATDPQHGSATDPQHGSATDPQHGSATDPQHGSATDPQHGSATDPQSGSATDRAGDQEPTVDPGTPAAEPIGGAPVRIDGVPAWPGGLATMPVVARLLGERPPAALLGPDPQRQHRLPEPAPPAVQRVRWDRDPGPESAAGEIGTSTGATDAGEMGTAARAVDPPAPAWPAGGNRPASGATASHPTTDPGLDAGSTPGAGYPLAPTPLPVARAVTPTTPPRSAPFVVPREFSWVGALGGSATAGAVAARPPAALPMVQRFDETPEAPVPEPAPPPEPAPEPAEPPPAPESPAALEGAAGTGPQPGAGAPPGAAGAGAEPEELLKKLFDPLLRRLRTELRLDRERHGLPSG